MQRRELMKLAALAAAMGAFSPRALMAGSGAKPLKILFLGGTGFIGPHMVQRALDRGHEVTLFNRGNSNDRFPELETLTGDRDGKLEALEGRRWDAVVDTSGYVPRHVGDSARLLKAGGTPHYLFISTVAVYEPSTTPGLDESAALRTMADPSVEKVDGDTYGPLKVLCEQAVDKHFPDAATILRPTFIVGPGDTTDRFAHYLERPLAGGSMAVPGPKEMPLTYVDVRDLADFTIHALEQQVYGRYNMVNAPGAATTGELMQRSLALSGAEVELVWISHAFLRQQELLGKGKPGYPMMVDPAEYGGFSSLSQAAAVAKGFQNRNFADTIKVTWDWWSSLPAERRSGRRVSLTPEIEASWIAAWKAAQA
ncbi:MAG: NAD-dependent epimerase/dehydratase family protein [Xanthomonadales bacterium]|nr:NAD-dependent epimerase/dehydratase family protein [Xanthomonadales bacterium]